MSMWQDGLLFGDDFLYVKLMTEKSEKKIETRTRDLLRDRQAF